MRYMRCMNVVGSFVKPNGITRNSKCPNIARNAASEYLPSEPVTDDNSILNRSYKIDEIHIVDQTSYRYVVKNICSLPLHNSTFGNQCIIASTVGLFGKRTETPQEETLGQMNSLLDIPSSCYFNSVSSTRAKR
jgi:hypothetical protein